MGVGCRQLEVLRNSDDGGERGSLLWLLDHTKTAMGGRLMRSWVVHPLLNMAMINERLDAVSELTSAGKSPAAHPLCEACGTTLGNAARRVSTVVLPGELIQAALHSFATGCGHATSPQRGCAAQLSGLVVQAKRGVS